MCVWCRYIIFITCFIIRNCFGFCYTDFNIIVNIGGYQNQSIEPKKRYLLLLSLFNLPEYSIMWLNLSVRTQKHTPSRNDCNNSMFSMYFIRVLSFETLTLFLFLSFAYIKAQFGPCISMLCHVFTAAKEKSTGLWAKYLNLKLIQF